MSEKSYNWLYAYVSLCSSNFVIGSQRGTGEHCFSLRRICLFAERRAISTAAASVGRAPPSRPRSSVRHSPDDQPLTTLPAPNLTGRVFVRRRSSWLCYDCNYSAICIKQLPLCVLTLALLYADVTKPFLTRFSHLCSLPFVYKTLMLRTTNNLAQNSTRR